MNVGKLYHYNNYYWILYPSKDIAIATHNLISGEIDAAVVPTAAEALCRYYSLRYKCKVSYLKPNSIFCLLEQDGKFMKILSTEGNIGWIYLSDWCKNDIEEVNQ